MLNATQLNRKSVLFISAIFVFFLSACTDNPMSSSAPASMIGEWKLSKIQVEGETADRANFEDVIVNLTLNPSNTGRYFIEDFGRVRNHVPYSLNWSDDQNLFQLEIDGGKVRKFFYALTSDQLTLSHDDFDNRRIQYTYHK